MQLNVNAYWILISCFILWTKNYTSELPFSAFQNLYHMKTTPSSARSSYFQAYQVIFDFDKNYKHLWFFAMGQWLHGQLNYEQVPPSKRVPITFRRGYVWTQGLHTEMSNLEKIERLREKADPEQN